MAVRTAFTTRIPEQSSARYTAVLKDETGAVVPGSHLTTLTLEIRDEATGTIILAKQSILNVNRGAVDESGNLTVTFRSSDSAMVSEASVEETHIALVEWTSGVLSGAHEVAIYVTNMTDRP